ncbi:hypothetical protein Tco_1303145 [Tanacetum coccineum]
MSRALALCKNGASRQAIRSNGKYTTQICNSFIAQMITLRKIGEMACVAFKPRKNRHVACWGARGGQRKWMSWSVVERESSGDSVNENGYLVQSLSGCGRVSECACFDEALMADISVGIV